MLFRTVQFASSIILGILITVNYIFGLVAAYDISVPKDPLGPLKVTLDYGLATTWPRPQDVNNGIAVRNWQFSSHIVFAGRVGDSNESDPPISDGQLWKMARDAVDEMEDDAKEYGINPKKLPTAMAVLAWGNEIILASSMKGAGSFSYDFLDGDTPVGRSLQQCQMVWRDISTPDSDQTQRHKNQGSCAEPMAAHLYYKNNNINLQTQKARVGTFVKRGKIWKETDPCGTGSEDFWGCNLFTQNQGLRVLDVNTPSQPYTLDNLAGGPIRQDQIQLCGGDPRVFVDE